MESLTLRPLSESSSLLRAVSHRDLPPTATVCDTLLRQQSEQHLHGGESFYLCASESQNKETRQYCEKRKRKCLSIRKVALIFECLLNV